MGEEQSKHLLETIPCDSCRKRIPRDELNCSAVTDEKVCDYCLNEHINELDEGDEDL